MPVISTNIAANSAVRYLNINSSEQTSSLSKLASGSRITQASDDAAGLAISTRISSDVTALTQAATNASHGISVLQTADGGASNISDILQRMKALASQSSSGTVTDTERAYIDAEFSQLVDEVDGIASSTRYNGDSLLDGSTAAYANGVGVMVGSDATDTITLKLSALDSATLGLKGGTATAAQPPADIVGTSTASITVTGGSTVSFSVNGTTVTLQDDGSGGDQTYDADDIAQAVNDALTTAGNTTVSASAAGGILTFSNTATGASANITLAGTTAGLGVTTLTSTGSAATTGSLSVSTQGGATSALSTLDAAINTVSKARADIGALESRFGFRSEQIATSIENLQAANSAIIDTDVASESSKLASAKVKTQAAVAAAAQASQMPQDLLKLLQ